MGRGKAAQLDVKCVYPGRAQGDGFSWRHAPASELTAILPITERDDAETDAVCRVGKRQTR